MEDEELRLSPRERVWREIRSRPNGYAVLAVSVVLGPIFTASVFPEAPGGLGLIGGIAFGVYAGLCAVPQKFL